MAPYFFPATRAAASQITELFDFVWPTAAALWNLRWQVGGFLNEVPAATPAQLNDRFVFGSGIHGTNLRKACVKTTWEEQKHHLSAILLTNAFAIYEHWTDEILISLAMTDGKGERLQRKDSPGGKIGLQTTVQNLCLPESSTLKTAYYPIYSSSPKHSWSKIANLMACYRFFKELRNAQVHNGGVASKRATDAYAAFAPVSGKAALGMKGDLIHAPVVEGEKVALHLRGLVGFCDILLRIIVTLDAELCRSERAEAVFEAAFKPLQKRTLSSNPKRRHMQIVNLCRAAGFPKTSDTELVRKFLISRGSNHLIWQHPVQQPSTATGSVPNCVRVPSSDSIRSG